MARDRSIFWQAYGPIRFLGLLKPQQSTGVSQESWRTFFKTARWPLCIGSGKPNLAQLEHNLLEFSNQTPIALVLPCHVKELGTAALRGSSGNCKMSSTSSRSWLASTAPMPTNWQRARRIFGQLPQKPILLWNDGPRMRRLIEQLSNPTLIRARPAKGRNLWLCFGYVLASDKSRMVAVHDCDIVTYSRELLARLCYPVAHPSLGIRFLQGLQRPVHRQAERPRDAPARHAVDSFAAKHHRSASRFWFIWTRSAIRSAAR